MNLHLSDGSHAVVGQGPPIVDWIIHSGSTLEHIVRDPQYGLGQTFLDRQWTTQPNQLAALIEVLLTNLPRRAHSWMWRRFMPLQAWLTSIGEYLHDTGTSKRHTESQRTRFVLERVLDQEMHHSCAYYTDPQINLEEAQRAKCRHLMSKLCLKPGQHILDVYCGFAAFALYVAEHADVRVTALTHTAAQMHEAQQKAIERNVAHRITFLLEDYPQHWGEYDRIVSVEACDIGLPAYRPFFKHLTDLLRPDGLALIHTVGHNRPNCCDEWIPHHSDIQFPYPTLGTVLQKMENLNIAVSDIEISHRHYALTFAAWQQRLNKYHSEIAARCGERFYRQWEFYLALCEALFRCRGLAVFEIQLAKNPNSVPLTRDYLYHNKEERRDRIVVQPVNGTLRIHVKK